MKKVFFLIPLLTIIILSGTLGTAFGSGDKGEGKALEKEKKIKVPFFDGIKFQITKARPKLTNASHVIHDLNDIAGTNLDDWDDIDIFTLDVVLWKDLSRYFKADFAIAGTTGELTDSGTAFSGSFFESDLRMRQRYSALLFWTNLYYYPFTTNYKDEYKSGHLIEPFIAAGLGYTLFRSESTFKLRGGPVEGRIRNNWNGNDWAFKMMTGFNINPGNINPKLEGWVVTFSAFYIWNRMKGHSSINDSTGLDLMPSPTRMDIDLTGYNFSLAIGHYF